MVWNSFGVRSRVVEFCVTYAGGPAMKCSVSKLPALVGWIAALAVGLTGCTRTDALPMAPAPRAVSATPAAAPAAEPEPVGQAAEQSAEEPVGASTTPEASTSENSTPVVVDIVPETELPKPEKK